MTMTPHIQQAVVDLTHQIERKLGTKLVRIILYGSALCSDSPGDIDIAVIVRDGSFRMRGRMMLELTGFRPPAHVVLLTEESMQRLRLLHAEHPPSRGNLAEAIDQGTVLKEVEEMLIDESGACELTAVTEHGKRVVIRCTREVLIWITIPTGGYSTERRQVPETRTMFRRKVPMELSWFRRKLLRDTRSFEERLEQALADGRTAFATAVAPTWDDLDDARRRASVTRRNAKMAAVVDKIAKDA